MMRSEWAETPAPPPPGSHWAPNARDTHPGARTTCQRPECVNDREDDAQWTPPPYLSVPVPQRRDNGQRP